MHHLLFCFVLFCFVLRNDIIIICTVPTDILFFPLLLQHIFLTARLRIAYRIVLCYISTFCFCFYLFVNFLISDARCNYDVQLLVPT